MESSASGPDFRGGCVVSNLENAFDPANPTGLFLGQQLGVLGSSSGPGGAAVDCDQITGTLSVTQNYNAAGSYSYPVPATAVKLEITVIGGGGGGAEIDIMNDLIPNGGCTYCSVDGETGGISRVEAGSTTLASASGGNGGVHSSGSTTTNAPALQGSPGTGGSPAGINGNTGTTLTGNQAPTGGQLPGFTEGRGGTGGSGGEEYGFQFYGGPGGGSGGIQTVTKCALANQTLTVVVGAGGRAASTADGRLAGNVAQAGMAGLARIPVYE